MKISILSLVILGLAAVTLHAGKSVSFEERGKVVQIPGQEMYSFTFKDNAKNDAETVYKFAKSQSEKISSFAGKTVFLNGNVLMNEIGYPYIVYIRKISQHEKIIGTMKHMKDAPKPFIGVISENKTYMVSWNLWNERKEEYRKYLNQVVIIEGELWKRADMDRIIKISNLTRKK